MKLSSKAFWYGDAAEKKKELSRRLRRRRIPKGLWYLVIPGSEEGNFHGLFEFFPAEEYHRNRKLYRGCTIIGVTDSREKAKELSAQIVGAVLKDTGGYDIRAWFEEGRA